MDRLLFATLPFRPGVLRSVAPFALALFFPLAAGAQDESALRINEILSSNKNTAPVNANGKYTDMLEIYNPTDAQVSLKDLILSDEVVKDSQGNYLPGPTAWKIPAGSILPKGFVLVFCDGDGVLVRDNLTGVVEAHSSFKLTQDGELAALFRPGASAAAPPALIDLVVFPRLAEGTSYGRFPDGAEAFCHMAVPSFRNKSILGGGSLTGQNKPCSNIPPEINLHAHTSIADAAGANPAGGAPVPLVALAWDEKEGGVAKVVVAYRVNSGSEIEAPLVLDVAQTALLTRVDPLNPTGPQIPDKNHSVWKGEIPGQAAGSVVTFTLKVEDGEGASGSDPNPVCSPAQQTNCKPPFRYRVGYEYGGPLVLNEVCPLNLHLIRDTTDLKFDDYIEICSAEDASLDGLWLSSSPFHPLGWQFPVGSKIKAGERLLVWCDSDETHTRAEIGQYHTNFNLSHDGEAIFIFESEANGSGLIDGFKFGLSEADKAYSRVPDCDPTAPFAVKDGTPGQPNAGPTEPQFKRGDADKSGGVDISDAVLTLNYLFLGGEAPPCPDAADADDSGGLDLTDAITVLIYLFQGGAPFQPPFPEAGPDPTKDGLGC